MSRAMKIKARRENERIYSTKKGEQQRDGTGSDDFLDISIRLNRKEKGERRKEKWIYNNTV